MTIQKTLNDSITKLKIPTPQLDAEVLLSFIFQVDRSWLHTYPEFEVSPTQQKAFNKLVKRRAKFEPIAYLVGTKEFYGNEFLVTPDVLIPRPESELIIDEIKYSYDPDRDLSIVDVGTGSGCLAITCAILFKKSSILAIDTSNKALDVTKTNAYRLDVLDRIALRKNHLLTNLKKEGLLVDIIIANLPYLTEADLADSPTADDLKYEPKSALLADDNGLALIKECSLQSVDILKVNGKIYFEMMPYQVSDFTLWIKEEKLPFDIKISKDLANLDRVVILTLNEKS